MNHLCLQLVQGLAYAAVLWAVIFRLDTGLIDVRVLATSALFCAQRLLCASLIAFRPTADSLRFGLGVSAGVSANG